jgi:hypothetical protein
LGSNAKQRTSVLKYCRDYPDLADRAFQEVIDAPNARDKTRFYFFRVDRLKTAQRMAV